jgi:hypothetical protein
VKLFYTVTLPRTEESSGEAVQQRRLLCSHAKTYQGLRECPAMKKIQTVDCRQSFGTACVQSKFHSAEGMRTKGRAKLSYLESSR